MYLCFDTLTEVISPHDGDLCVVSTHGEKYLLVMTIELRKITGTSFRGVYLEFLKKFNTFNG